MSALTHTIFKKHKARLKKLSVTHFCDASEKVRVLSNQIRPISKGLKMVGVAYTVASQGDLLAVFQALKFAKQDEVLVVDGHGKPYALAGELITMEAKRKRLAGIVIDGACRDVDMISQIKFPFYAKSVHPKAATRKILGKTQGLIRCGDVKVRYGDIVVGDDNGIVFIAPNDLEAVLLLAETKYKNEKIVLKNMKKGISLIDMLNLDEHCAKIKRGKKSSLVFKLRGR